MYQLYLVKYAGVDAATGQALYYAKTTPDANATEAEKAAFVPETYLTSDWQVAYSTGREVTGDLLPNVYGGFGTTVEYAGFDLSVQMAYQLGGKIWDYTYQDLMHGGNANDAGQNWHKDIAKAWSPTNTQTDVPRLNTNDKYTNSSSDRWLISSNYLSINNITLGYTIPKSLTRKIGVEGLRIYGAADNLALFAARKGLDPRKGYVSTTTSTYGALRTISGGVKLTF